MISLHTIQWLVDELTNVYHIKDNQWISIIVLSGLTSRVMNALLSSTVCDESDPAKLGRNPDCRRWTPEGFRRRRGHIHFAWFILRKSREYFYFLAIFVQTENFEKLLSCRWRTKAFLLLQVQLSPRSWSRPMEHMPLSRPSARMSRPVERPKKTRCLRLSRIVVPCSWVGLSAVNVQN